MKTRILSLLILFLSFTSFRLKAQEYEKICSKRYHYCFQLPYNFMMLETGDIESPSLSFRTVDGSSTLSFANGDLAEGTSFHSLYLMQLGEYSNRNFKINLKKEYNSFFILSGYTASGKGFYQKVVKDNAHYVSAYLEFPKGNARFSNMSQMLFDYFETTVLN